MDQVLVAADALAARQTCDIPEMARILGISRNMGYQLAQTGTVRTIRLGRRLVVPLAEINRLLRGDQAQS